MEVSFDMCVNDNDFLKNLGLSIRRYRQKSGLSQAELAMRCGFEKSNSRSTISKIETGINDVSASTLVRIAKELGVTVCELIGEQGNDLSLQQCSIPDNFDPDTGALLEVFQTLDKSGQDELMRYAKYVSSQEQLRDK